MGLVERRALKAFQDSRFPELVGQINEAAGFAVDLEVDWQSLAVDDYAHLYDEAWTKVYFQPLIEALKAITIDDMGKEALREGLKQVVIRDSGTRQTGFSGGVLTFHRNPVSNLDDWEERKQELQTALEKGL